MDPNAKLTFGQLEVGQKFIFFPSPGDNSGHGGFLGKQNVFSKTRLGSLLHNSGEGVNIQTGTVSSFPENMAVIALNL